MARTSLYLIFGTYLRPVKNMSPPAKVKIHDRPRLDQEFVDERCSYLRSAENLMLRTRFNSNYSE